MKSSLHVCINQIDINNEMFLSHKTSLIDWNLQYGAIKMIKFLAGKTPNFLQ